MLLLYRETYSDCSVRHFHEKLQEKHGIELSYTWVKLALQDAGQFRPQDRQAVLNDLNSLGPQGGGGGLRRGRS